MLAIGWFGLFVILQGSEAQDVMLRGNNDMTEHYLDGKFVGKGLLVCVPKIPQGKHSIEQHTAGQTRTVTANVGDVGIQVLKTSEAATEDVIFLSNCSKNTLAQ